MNKKKRKSKYYAPQTDKTCKKCDYPDCEEPAEFKAPKDKSLKEYYWFCLKHVREYNESWDYYSDMTPEEIEHHIRSDALWQNQTWRFGTRAANYKTNDSFGFFYQDKNSENQEARYVNSEQENAMQIMELIPPFDLKDLHKRYKVLAKKYHPDITGGDKDAEERFKLVVNAYNLLKEFFKE
ncbi:MAG: DnaJ domain-containing protein [Alphaproteobacteria bacterium]